MRRTQIYLDQAQIRRLRSAAKSSRRTVSEVIREAVDEKLARPVEPEFDVTLRNALGIWADRNDLGSTDDYVRKIREDRRGRPSR